jgi:hypothetical protein
MNNESPRAICPYADALTEGQGYCSILWWGNQPHIKAALNKYDVLILRMVTEQTTSTIRALDQSVYF